MQRREDTRKVRIDLSMLDLHFLAALRAQSGHGRFSLRRLLTAASIEWSLSISHYTGRVALAIGGERGIGPKNRQGVVTKLPLNDHRVAEAFAQKVHGRESRFVYIVNPSRLLISQSTS